jgi:hypothetical protein
MMILARSTSHRPRTRREPQAIKLDQAGVSCEEIARLAYSYWEARGRQHGSPNEDWFRAERELWKPKLDKEYCSS